MNVYKLTPATIPAVAHLMCTVKPDWWDYDGAYGQLSNIDEPSKQWVGLSERILTIPKVGFYVEN